MSDFMMALCNQPEAFASDLVDDQSRYLYWQELWSAVDEA